MSKEQKIVANDYIIDYKIYWFDFSRMIFRLFYAVLATYV